MRTLALAILVLFSAASPATVRDPDAERILAAARAENRALAHARHLAADIGPRLTGSKNLARAEKWARDQFRSFGLENARLERWGSVPRDDRRARAVHNVVADIRGASKPDEYVIVGAHLDSWDHAQGATDNAAGAGAVMEAARLLAASGVEPDRTIRFVLFTGEEQGLLGSRAYVDAHRDLLAKTSAVFVMDAGTNPVSGLLVTRTMYPAAVNALAGLMHHEPAFVLRAVDALPLPADCCTPSCAEQTRASCKSASSCALPTDGTAACPSDHVPFLRAGVPAFIWEQSGPADYRKTHHTELDTADALLAEGVERSALAIALAAFGVAELPELLSRENMIARAPGGVIPAVCAPTGR
jgi:hypothetical protein